MRVTNIKSVTRVKYRYLFTGKQFVSAVWLTRYMPIQMAYNRYSLIWTPKGMI